MLKLSEQEKQDIIRYLEADRPLPDKYRFLLFEDRREVELVWNGKGSDVYNVVLPFQIIEHVDEPRAEKPEDTSPQGALFDARGRQLKGWTNKLIWGDNKLILSSLKNGPLWEEIEQQGGSRVVVEQGQVVKVSRNTDGTVSRESLTRHLSAYVFESEWQSFRTKKNRSLEPINVAHECPPGRHKTAVKVVDIFGNDTMTIVEVV